MVKSILLLIGWNARLNSGDSNPGSSPGHLNEQPLITVINDLSFFKSISRKVI